MHASISYVYVYDSMVSFDWRSLNTIWYWVIFFHTLKVWNTDTQSEL